MELLIKMNGYEYTCIYICLLDNRLNTKTNPKILNLTSAIKVAAKYAM